MQLYLLFDLDRTLWDFDGNADRTFRDMFDAFGLASVCHADYETFHEKYRTVNDMLWEMYRNGTLSKELLYVRRFSLTLSAFGLSADSPETVRLSRRLGDYYVTMGPEQTGLMPGARFLLEWLASRRDRYSLAVITNGFSEAQLPKMKTAGIDRYFDNFFLSEDLGYMKPDRRFFDAVLSRLGVPADRCLVVGDEYAVDIVGAMQSGIRQVWYNPSARPVPSGARPPSFEIRHLDELRQVLQQV